MLPTSGAAWSTGTLASEAEALGPAGGGKTLGPGALESAGVPLPGRDWAADAGVGGKSMADMVSSGRAATRQRYRARMTIPREAPSLSSFTYGWMARRVSPASPRGMRRLWPGFGWKAGAAPAGSPARG